MRRHIEKLKQQHPAVRSRVALMTAASVTGVIALVWLTTLPIRYDGALSSGDIDATANTISAFGEAVSPHVDEITNAFSQGTAQPTGVPGLDVVPNPTDRSSAPEDTPGADTALPIGEETGSGMRSGTVGTENY